MGRVMAMPGARSTAYQVIIVGSVALPVGDKKARAEGDSPERDLLKRSLKAEGSPLGDTRAGANARAKVSPVSENGALNRSGYPPRGVRGG